MFSGPVKWLITVNCASSALGMVNAVAKNFLHFLVVGISLDQSGAAFRSRSKSPMLATVALTGVPLGGDTESVEGQVVAHIRGHKRHLTLGPR